MPRPPSQDSSALDNMMIHSRYRIDTGCTMEQCWGWFIIRITLPQPGIAHTFESETFLVASS